MILLGCGLGFGLLGWPAGSRVAGAGSGACCCTSVVQLYACTSSLAHLPPPPLPAFGRPQVERVHIPRPKDGDTHSKFGFVHFRERAGAVRAVEDDDKPQLEGTSLTVSGSGWDGMPLSARGSCSRATPAWDPRRDRMRSQPLPSLFVAACLPFVAAFLPD